MIYPLGVLLVLLPLLYLPFSVTAAGTSSTCVFVLMPRSSYYYGVVSVLDFPRSEAKLINVSSSTARLCIGVLRIPT